MLAVRCVGPLVFVLAALAPLTAYAQGSITGMVKDTSGAVLPGVTVEVSSPALIEKVRVTVSDDTGQYRIVDLRPGTLQSHVHVDRLQYGRAERESSSWARSPPRSTRRWASGAVQETVTVAGETPVVDIQNTSRQHVISDEVIDAIPAGRSHYDLAALIPGLTGIQFGRSGFQDVGGTNNLQIAALSIHGGTFMDTRVMMNGLTSRNLLSSAWATNFIADTGTAAEWTIDYAVAGGGGDRQRRQLQHDSERGRQQVQRLGLCDRRKRRLSVEQLHTRAGGARPEDAGRACYRCTTSIPPVAARFSGTGCGSTARCAGRRTSSTFLVRLAMPTPDSKTNGSGCRREPARQVRHDAEERQHPFDVPGNAAEQVLLLARAADRGTGSTRAPRPRRNRLPTTGFT